MMPSREIIPPNLLKARYFRSGKNTPEGSDNEGEIDEYEDWNVENVLAGKANKKRKVNKTKDPNFNPYKQGKIQLGKKIMKETLDNKIDPSLAAKVREKRRRMGKEGNQVEDVYDEDFEPEESEATKEFNAKKEYYERMLGEDGLKKLEDLKQMNIYTKEEDEERKNKEMEEEAEAEEMQKEQMEKEMMDSQMYCPICSKSQPLTGASLLKKKENPALYAPGTITSNGYVCCLHHSKELFTTEDKDPRNFKCMPPCMMESITPAGRPTKKEEALNLFA
ncbi:MAG: hypothetical protein MJ252_20705 [archaeon]|nr:hypothetical protein [archaeon]